MAGNLSDGMKIAITMMIVCATVALIVVILRSTMIWSQGTTQKLSPAQYVDHVHDFEAMSIYGDKIPMASVVAALDLHGDPSVLCLQLEDLKGELNGNPYPTATAGTAEMTILLNEMKKHFDKEVYVYTYTGSGLTGQKGDLQLCISELPHDSNPDAAGQDWMDD